MFDVALDRLAGQDVAAVDDARLEADVVAIDRALAGLTAQRLRRVAEVQRRRGARAAEAWLQTGGRLSPRAAAQQRQTAERLEALPETAAALAAGDIDAERAGILASAATDARREALVADERSLVAAAKTLDAPALRREVDRWRHATDTAASLDEANARYQRRWLKVAPADDGMLSVRGELDPEQGAIVQTALNALRPDHAGGANGTFAQRTVDALTDVCRRVLALDPDLPAVHGRRPHVTVVVTADGLADAPGAPVARMDWVGAVCSETARRYTCDAWLTRVIATGDSQPLDVGRAARTATLAQRAALAVRDAGCVGCGEQPMLCEAHHIRAWEHLGPTDLDNLALVCWRCHRKIHEGGWRLTRQPDHHWHLHPPDRDIPLLATKRADAPPGHRAPVTLAV